MPNDRELIALLERAPERGMEEIVTQCTPTLCAVAARRVDDSEEVKDLVNETFLQFYEHRERFDPGKGSLVAYLSVITDRLAIKRYRELSRPNAFSAEADDAQDCAEETALRLDLESALGQLDPVDAQIVREKYYNGKSFHEIAASLGLPYETVKKRHQRSLKKLLRAMTIGLLLAALAAILAACSYLVLRYFGLVPGYGVNTDAETPAYVLEETVAPETADYAFRVEDGWWSGGLLTLQCTVTLPQESESVDTFLSQLGLALTLEGETEWTLLKTSSARLDPCTERIELYFRGELPTAAGEVLTLRLLGAAEPLTLTLRRAEETSYELAGAFALTEGEGGLLAVPRRENGELIVAIYPLSEGDFVIDPGLTKAFEETQPVTVTAEDGTVLVGSPVGWHSFGSETYFDWNFGAAAAGTYTLNVPYVYERLADYTSRAGLYSMAESVAFPLSVPNIGETTVAFPHGSVTLSAGERITDYDPLPSADTPEIAAMRTVYDEFTWQELTVALSCTDETREIVNLSLASEGREGIELSVGDTTLMVATESLTLLSDLVTDEASGVTVSRPGNARLGWHESVAEIPCSLSLGSLAYRWEHPFVISFTVE